MRRSIIVWLSIGGALMVLGALLFTVTMSLSKWNFAKLDSTKYEMSTYEIKDDFKNINVKVDTAKIEIKSSNDGKCRVECYEYEKARHEVYVESRSLDIEVKNTRKWYDYISFFNFSTPKITVYLPQESYGDLNVDGSTGSVSVKEGFSFKNVNIAISTGDISFESNTRERLKLKASTGDISVKKAEVDRLDLFVTTGDIKLSNVKCAAGLEMFVATGKTYLSNVTCQNLISEGNTGDMSMQNVIASDKFDIKRSTGDVRFEKCDAGEIYIETDTGDVKGTLFGEKIFICRTDTGKVSVPKSTSGGKCEITTDTGNIKITVIE